MPTGRAALAFAGLLACAACAARVETARPPAPPAAAAPAPREAPPRPVDVPSGSGTSAGSAQGAQAPAQAAAVPSSAAQKADSATAPPATASAYVFSPQQAVSAQPGASPQSGASPVPLAPSKPAAVPRPPAAAPSQPDPSAAPNITPEPARGELQLIVVASAPSIATGAVVTVDVLATSNAAVLDAPLHLTFDPGVVEFVDGAPGDFLTQGGSSVVFFADGLSHPGDVAVAAGRVERGRGAVGSGLLCRIRFRGVAQGATSVAIGQAKAWGTRGEELAVAAAGTRVLVN